MSAWMIDAALGGALGVLLYACVRLRMFAGPRVKQAYGKWPRRMIWILILALMIGVGNLMLFVERYSLQKTGIADNLLAHELLFALVALTIGLLLVIARVRRKK